MKVFLGQRFIDALLATGVIDAGELVTRVVIDAEVGELVKVYVERYGDERLLDVVPALTGVEVLPA